MTVIGLVPVCDCVIEDDRRLALVGPDPVWASSAVEVTPEQLRRVPYTVEFSERLRARVPRSG